MKRVRIYPPCPECGNMDPEMKKGGNWIQEATDSIEKRGTKGKCTGSNFGGSGCPPGSPAYNLAKTFRKMAASNKKALGGEADQNFGIDEFGQTRLNKFKNALAGRAINAVTENALIGAIENPPGMYPYGGNTNSGYGYNPDLYNIDPYIQMQQEQQVNFGNSLNQFIDGITQFNNSPTQYKAKTVWNKEHPDYKALKEDYRSYEKTQRQNPQMLWQLPQAQSGKEIQPFDPMYERAYEPAGNQLIDWAAGKTPEEIAAYKQWWLATRNNNQAGMLPVASNMNATWENAFNPAPYGSTVKSYTPQPKTTQVSNSQPKTTQNAGTTQNVATGTTGATGRTITEADIKTNPTTTDAATKVQQAQTKLGNYDTGIIEENNQQQTVQQNNENPVNYNTPGYNPFIVYPKMGMFGQRTGQVPIAFDPAQTHVSQVDYRRRLFPGKNNPNGQVKSIYFDHHMSMPGTKPTTTTKPTQQIPQNTNGNVQLTDEQRTFVNDETPYWRDNADNMFMHGGPLTKFQTLGEVPKPTYQQTRDAFQAEMMQPSFALPFGMKDKIIDYASMSQPGNENDFDNAALQTKLTQKKDFLGTMLPSALAMATSIGRQRTAQGYNLEDMTTADKVFNRRRIADMGEIPFNFAGNYENLAQYTPVQNKGFTAKKGGKVPKFKQGGTYDLTEQEIQELLNSGAHIEFID